MTTAVTPETLFAALSAWDAWEQAAARAADASREATGRAAIDAAWSEAERLLAVAKEHRAPGSLLRRTAEERVIAQALAQARATSEERVRAYTRGLVDVAVGAGGEDGDG